MGIVAGLFALDMVALADAGSREDFDDLEFLVTRALDEWNAMRSYISVSLRSFSRRRSASASSPC